MKKTILFLFLFTMISSCKENRIKNKANVTKPQENETFENQEYISELQEKILTQYNRIPKIYYGDLKTDGYGSPEFNEIMKSLSDLRNTDYGKKFSHRINILEFKVLYLYQENEKAIEKINKIDNDDIEIEKTLYQGVFYELTGNEKVATQKYERVYELIKKNGIYDYNCQNFNFILILARKNLSNLKDCKVQNLPDDYYQKLKEKDRKELLFDAFFYRVEI